MVSSMLSGACATPEFLMYMNYFIGLEYGRDYHKNADQVVDLSKKQRTLDKMITDYFEQIVYSINQPTGARNFQAVFWNISYYDKFYFESLFENFVFPDGSKPDWDSLSWLQKRFMRWFNQERTRSILTFPVETMALLTQKGEPKDKEYGDFTAEMYTEGHSFFTYLSDNADSLSSCCRLRNEINDNLIYEEFVQQILGLIERYNKKYRSQDVMFNCEMIPAENVGVKHAKWDREAGYKVARDCYNSYFYIVEDDSLNVIDKFRLHGRKYIEHLTGGSALHLNLEEHLSKEQYAQLLRVATQEGCNYFTFNIPNTVCNKCGHIDKRKIAQCPSCSGSDSPKTNQRLYKVTNGKLVDITNHFQKQTR